MLFTAVDLGVAATGVEVTIGGIESRVQDDKAPSGEDRLALDLERLLQGYVESSK